MRFINLSCVSALNYAHCTMVCLVTLHMKEGEHVIVMDSLTPPPSSQKMARGRWKVEKTLKSLIMTAICCQCLVIGDGHGVTHNVHRMQLCVSCS